MRFAYFGTRSGDQSRGISGDGVGANAPMPPVRTGSFLNTAGMH